MDWFRRLSQAVMLSTAIVLPAQAGQPAAKRADSTELAAKIDRHIAAGWDNAQVKPAELVDDAAFLRRATLDLIGRIPSVSEIRAFQEDKNPDKRVLVVDGHLNTGAHVHHAARFWRRVWIPQADTAQFARLSNDFEGWLAMRMSENVSYDVLVRELLTVPRIPAARRGNRVAVSSGISPSAFLTASEFKPENLAANTSRAFLGINLDCAQCHDHPFSKWRRDQFWETAAFFSQPTNDHDVVDRLEVTIPGTERVVAARFLVDAPMQLPQPLEEDNGRQLLAGWITSNENPFFARNAVNRMWAHYFGHGLVEPLDDLSGDNPASHPELLDELSRAFVASGFDIKFMTRAMLISRTYQLSSIPAATGAAAEDVRLLTHMPVRGLTGEQLYASLRIAAGLPPERNDLDGARLEPRQQFINRFFVERPSAAERSILQALSLMNGRLTAELTDPDKNPTVGAVAEAPFLDSKGKVETLFLSALCRWPQESEIATLTSCVERGGADANLRKALADVFWVLLNSSEFSTNH